MLIESMTRVLLSLSQTTTYSDLRIYYGSLEIRSKGDEYMFSGGSYQFTVAAVRSSKDALTLRSVPS
jgi:hypothetical protein